VLNFDFSADFGRETVRFREIIYMIFPNHLHDLPPVMQIIPGNDRNHLGSHLHHFGKRGVKRAVSGLFSRKNEKVRVSGNNRFRAKRQKTGSKSLFLFFDAEYADFKQIRILESGQPYQNLLTA